MDGHYYCRKDRKHYNIGHNEDVEKVIGICPDCSGRLILNHNSLEKTIKNLALSKSEISDKKVVNTVKV